MLLALIELGLKWKEEKRGRTGTLVCVVGRVRFVREGSVLGL
jgi:hypothetical protein